MLEDVVAVTAAGKSLRANPSPLHGEGKGESRGGRNAKKPAPHPDPLPPVGGEGILLERLT